jgi:GNAT superfamily N-acetyltransferase
MSNLTIRPALPEEWDAISTLIAQGLSQGDVRRYEQILHERRIVLPQKPGFAFDTVRVGVLNGRLVAVGRIEDCTLYYGYTSVRAARILDVVTHPDVRRRGYASAIMRELLTMLAEQGRHVAILRDPNTFYTRHGFNPVWPSYTFQFNGRGLRNSSQHTIRPATPHDLPALADLYHLHWHRRIAVQRSPQWWMWRWQHRERPFVIINAQDEIEGYVWPNVMESDPPEVVVDTYEAAASLLYSASQDSPYNLITWALPPDDALIAYAELMVPVTVSASYEPHSGWMARLVNAVALIQTVMPEIVRMAQFGNPTFDPSHVMIEVQPDVVQVGLRAQPHLQMAIAHQDFLRVLFGSLRPAMLAVRMALTFEQVHLLEMLFPPRMGAFAPGDW